MRCPFIKNPGSVTDYGQPIYFPPAVRTCRVLFSRRLIRFFSILPMLLLLAPPCLIESYVHAGVTPTAGKTTITVLPEQERDKAPQVDAAQQRIQVKRLQQGIKEHEKKIRTTREEGQSLLAELEKIERTIRTQKRKLSLLRDSHDQQEKLLTAEQKRLDLAIAEKQALQTYVQARLTAYYQMGGIGLMNIIFSKKSLSELLSFQEYFQRMLQYDQMAITSYAAKIAEIVQIRRKHEYEKNRLLELVVKVQAREELLKATRLEKTTLLNRVKTEEKLYQQAVNEIEKAADRLTASLEERYQQEKTKSPVLKPYSAKKRLSAEPEPPRQEIPADNTFAAQKGKLAPPVTGTVALPHDPQQNKWDATSPLAGGIDIITTENQEIRAVFAGAVIASGYLRGYGNMIIIDHGQHYYSLVSRAGELLKEEGTTVQTGEVIGLTGDSGTLLGEGLHFEVRRGSMNEDPLQWLDKEQLIFHY